jgi:hypothetical protein
MEIETKLQALEGEFKLMKGELKQALTDVRDFLVTFPAPTINESVFERFHEMQTGMGGGGSPPETPRERPQEPEDTVSAEMEIPEEEEETEEPETQETSKDELEETPENELEEEPSEAETGEELPPEDNISSNPATGVNVLTNLIRWVLVAKQELGNGQLTALLDIYGQQATLPPQTRQLILQLSEVIDIPKESFRSSDFLARAIREQLSSLLETRANSCQISPELKDSILGMVGMMAELPDKPADVWSRLILELHGILSCGSLVPVSAQSKSEQTIILSKRVRPKQKAKDQKKPMKLKLIMPVGKGIERELVFQLDTGIAKSKKKTPARNQ